MVLRAMRDYDPTDSGKATRAGQFMDSQEFRQLMDRVRQRDPQAIRELLESFSPIVVAAVRRSLTAETRRDFDSSDFAQIVWGSVLTDLQRIESIDSPQRLAKLLIKIARHKVIDQHRRQHRTQKRDAGTRVPLEGDHVEPRIVDGAVARRRRRNMRSPPSCGTACSPRRRRIIDRFCKCAATGSTVPRLPSGSRFMNGPYDDCSKSCSKASCSSRVAI